MQLVNYYYTWIGFTGEAFMNLNLKHETKLSWYSNGWEVYHEI